MNNRFSFRVWFTPDYQEPEMIYDAEQTYDFGCQSKGSYHHDNFGEILEDKDCVVMQCTGLKTKYGELIYESDILGGTLEGCFVHWCDKCKQFELAIKYKGQTECMACNGDVHWYEVVEEDGNLEVLGNFYENPELLEDNNG